LPTGPSAPIPPDPTRGTRFGSFELLLLVALAVLWGSAYIFIREGIVLGASPILFASVRYLLSAVGFFAIAGLAQDPRPSRRALLISSTLGGFLIIGFYGGLLYWGEQSTSGGYAAVLSSTAPILTVVFAFFLLPAERLSASAILGIGLGFVGTIMLVAPTLLQGTAGGLGPLFIVGAFLSTAIGTVLLRRIEIGRQGLWQLGAQFAVGGLFLGGLAAVLPYPETLPLTVPVLGALAGLIVFASLLGYFVYFTLHHRVGPVHANSVTYLLPLVAIAIGTGLFGEPVTVWEVLGFAIVASGVTLVLRGARPPEPSTPPAPAGPRFERPPGGGNTDIGGRP
jgi:probable blue pigment (indigoidine) exporter